MARCFVTRPLPGSALERLAAEHEVEIWRERLPPTASELAEHAAGAEGLLTMLTDRLDADFLAGAGADELRAISNYAVGYDNVDLEATRARGIPVGHTPDVLTDATADLAFTLLLAAARKLPDAISAARSGEWVTWEPGMYLGQAVHGATLGIVGFGRIGRALARRSEGFEMTVINTATGSTPGVTQDELLERSDFISLHVPLTADTHHLIDAEALARMKDTAILVNTARGQIVDQDALIQALNNGIITGAALDVTDPEPLPQDHRMFRTPNLLITPHIGSATRAAREQMAEMAVDNLLAGLAGEPMPHEAR